MHREAEVAIGRERGVTGVDPHPYLDHGSFRPRLFGQRALRGDGRIDRVLRAAERDEERVALRVDLLAARLLEGPAQEPAVRREQVSVGVAELPEEAVEPSMSVNRNVTVPLGRSSMDLSLARGGAR